MQVRVIYQAQIRSVVGCPSESIELHEHASVLALLETLAARYGEPLRSHLFSTEITIRPSLMVIVNNSPLPHGAARTTTLQEGDGVTLLPPIAGG